MGALAGVGQLTTPPLTRDEVDQLITRRRLIQSRCGQLTRWINAGQWSIDAARVERTKLLAELDAILDRLIANESWFRMGRNAREIERWRIHKIPDWAKE